MKHYVITFHHPEGGLVKFHISTDSMSAAQEAFVDYFDERKLEIPVIHSIRIKE